MQMLEHKTIAYIKYDGKPSAKNHDFVLKGTGTLEIKPTDPHYHKTGTYYVSIVADADFLDLFRDRHFSFVMQWRTMNTVPHLNSQGIIQVQVPKGQVV